MKRAKHSRIPDKNKNILKKLGILDFFKWKTKSFYFQKILSSTSKILIGKPTQGKRNKIVIPKKCLKDY